MANLFCAMWIASDRPKKILEPPVRMGWGVSPNHLYTSTSELRCVVAAPQQLLPIELRL